MFSDQQVESVLAHWPFINLPGRVIEPVTQGLSGAFVSRVKLGSGPDQPGQASRAWALKAWPLGTPASRVWEVQSCIRKASSHCGLLNPSQPLSTTANASVMAFERIWELSPWVVGRSLEPDTDRENLELAGRAIANVHQALLDSSPRQNVDSPSQTSGRIPSIVRRCNRLEELDRQLATVLQDPPPLEAIVNLVKRQVVSHQASSDSDCQLLAESVWSAIDLLRRVWRPHYSRIQTSLEPFRGGGVSFSLQNVLRDVHREHILFDGLFDDEPMRVSGIIDYDAIGMDSPAVDVGRYAGDFECSRFDTIEAVAAGYRVVRPFSTGEQQLARWLVDANALGGLANWVIWLVLEKKQFSCEPRVIQGRISHLIASNCRIW